MKCFAPLLVAALLTAPSLAQTAASPTQQPHVTWPPPNTAAHSGWPWSLYASMPGCPIALRARQGSGLRMFVAHGAQGHSTPEHPAQRLHLSLTNSRENSILGVTLAVHGLTATARVTPASPSAGTITRTLHLDLTLDPHANTAADLTLESFTSVSRIDLVAIDYADGSSWHAPSIGACHITPERLMLVSSR